MQRACANLCSQRSTPSSSFLYRKIGCCCIQHNALFCRRYAKCGRGHICRHYTLFKHLNHSIQRTTLIATHFQCGIQCRAWQQLSTVHHTSYKVPLIICSVCFISKIEKYLFNPFLFFFIFNFVLLLLGHWQQAFLLIVIPNDDPVWLWCFYFFVSCLRFLHFFSFYDCPILAGDSSYFFCPQRSCCSQDILSSWWCQMMFGHSSNIAD